MLSDELWATSKRSAYNMMDFSRFLQVSTVAPSRGTGGELIIKVGTV